MDPARSCPSEQGAVSHSFVEAEIIALDAAIRMEGIPVSVLWDQIIDLFYDENQFGYGKPSRQKKATKIKSYLLDFVPLTYAKSGKAHMFSWKLLRA